MKKRLELTEFIRAPRARVYDAWVRPELVRLWFCPENLRSGEMEADFRVDGKFRSAMVGPDETYVATGVYREIVPGRRLVFTHGWEGPDYFETLVTVEFLDRDGGTEVRLVHEGLEDDESLAGHREGWKSTLENLAKKIGA